MNLVKSSFDKLLLGLVYISFVVIVFLPLFYSNSFYFPNITFRNFIFRFTIEIQSIAWLILIYKKKIILPKLPVPILGLLAFTIIVALADAQGIDPERSLWGTLERMDGFINLAHLTLFSLILFSTLRNREQWKKFAYLSFFIALSISCFGLYEASGDHRLLITATIGNSGYLAIYILFHIFLSILLFHESVRKFNKEFFIFIISQIIFFLALYNTGSRGSFLGLLIGGLATVVIIGIRAKQYRYIKNMLLLLLCFTLLFGAGLWNLRNSSFVKSSRTLTRLVEPGYTSSTRFNLWKVAYEGIKERPLFGWGQENFEYVVDRYYVTSLGNSEPWFDRTHNAFLDWFIAGGVLAGAAYLIIIFSTYLLLWKENTLITFKNKAVITGMLTGYLIHNFFFFDFLISSIMFLVTITLISIANIPKELGTPKLYKVLSTVLVFFAIYSFFASGFSGVQHAKSINSAITISGNGRSYEASLILNEIIMNKAFSSNEALGQFSAMASVSKNEKLMSDAIEKINAEELKRAKLFFSELILMAKIKDSNIESIEKRFNSEIVNYPNRHILYFSMIELYLTKNQFQKAEDLARKIYLIDTSVKRAKALYALSALLNKNVDLCDKLLSEMDLKDYIENPIYLEGYKALGRVDKVILHLKKMISYNEKDPNNYLKLGMVYSSLGKTNEAKEEFDKAQKITQENLLNN